MKNPVEKIASNPVTSVAVMVFSAPKTEFENGFPGPLGPGAQKVQNRVEKESK